MSNTRKKIELHENVDDTQFVCPYCGSGYGGRMSCCGESVAHGVTIYLDVDGNMIDPYTGEPTEDFGG